MIEYDPASEIYIIHFNDQTDLMGWVRELNGQVFVGLNDAFPAQRSRVMKRLLSSANNQIRKEMLVVELSRK